MLPTCLQSCLGNGLGVCITVVLVVLAPRLVAPEFWKLLCCMTTDFFDYSWLVDVPFGTQVVGASIFLLVMDDSWISCQRHVVQ